MKILLILFLALGCVLSLAIGIEYHCEGTEMFPTYYGNPFVFKRSSLGSSMEYYYSLFGLIANVLIWGLVLFLLDQGIQHIIKYRILKIGYTVLISLMLLLTSVEVYGAFIMLGIGFDKDTTYWYWDMEQEAKTWGMSCKGKLVIYPILT